MEESSIKILETPCFQINCIMYNVLIKALFQPCVIFTKLLYVSLQTIFTKYYSEYNVALLLMLLFISLIILQHCIQSIGTRKSNKVQPQCLTKQAAGVADQSATGIISGKLHHEKISNQQTVM